MPEIYTAFTGAAFTPDEIGGITITRVRSAAPIYTMGSPNPRSTHGGQNRRIEGEITLIKPISAQIGAFFDVKVVFDDEFAQKVKKTVYGVCFDEISLNAQFPILNIANLPQGTRITVPAGSVIAYKARNAGPLTFVQKYGRLGTAVRQSRKILV